MNSGHPCLGAHGGGLVPLGGDGGQVRADNPTLVLDGAARTLLGDLFGDTLFVHAAVHLRPCDLARVLALAKERGVLGAGEAEDLRGQSVQWMGESGGLRHDAHLGVAAHKEFTLGWVDAVARENVDFELLCAQDDRSACVLD